MGRDKSRRLSGSRHFRQRLVLATLTSTAVTIEDIRSGDAAPGLHPHEVSLLHLLDKISDHHTIDLNETGTKLKYRPGVIIGGKGLEHDCGLHSIGYFLEPLILLGLFARAPISIRLKVEGRAATAPRTPERWPALPRTPEYASPDVNASRKEK